jgi:hypothetical protein
MWALLLLRADSLESLDLCVTCKASGDGSRELFLHFMMVRKAIGGHLAGAFADPMVTGLILGDIISSYNRIIL